MKINLTQLTKFPVPVRLVCFILALLFLWLPLAAPIYWLVEDTNLESILTLVILYIEFIFLLNVWGKKVYLQSGIFSHYGLEFTRLNGVDLLRGLAIGLTTVLVLFGLEGVLGWLVWQQPQVFLVKIILEGLLVSLGVGFAEELLFRGWLLDELQRDYKLNTALGINAILFAVSHFIKPLAAIIHTLPQFPALVLLGLTQVWGKRWRRGRLGLPIGLHGGLVWGYYIINVGQLTQYSGQVPDWITGVNNNPLQGVMGVLFMGGLAWWIGSKQQVTGKSIEFEHGHPDSDNLNFIMAYFTPGQLLKRGQYEIIDTLGQGGFGITYLAQDHRRKKEVAIKSLNVSFLKQRYRDKYGNTDSFGDFLAEEQDKFNTEAIVLATFDHPHIVKVYPELFQENGLSCMVMEYVKGKNLEQYLYANGVFSESAGLEIIKGIGEALSYIHSRNYLHRDIKPANILLRESDNKAILIDFGLAREVNFAELMSLTNAKTPVFAPPEQFENRSNFTPALDIYALAATLYVIIAVHEPPFIPLPSPYLNAKIMLDMKMAIEPPQKYNSQISQKVNDAILKGMELDYQNRPQSITEWFTFLGIQSQNNHLKTFTFEVVTTNAKGSIINKRNHSANYFVEDLGNGVMLEMVEIPAGTFYMGSPESEEGRYRYDSESPQHQVTVPSFFIGKYPLTQAQYQAIMGNNPAHFKGNNRPVEKVSWLDGVAFSQKLSQKTGKNYKLPSEAQWEYACRAGTTTPFYFGESITPDLVNCDGNYAYAAAPKGQCRKQTTDVGTFLPNAFGLYDMHGNVWEWCEDDWQENYINAPIDGSALISRSNVNLLRGGSWGNFPEICRSAFRHHINLDNLNYLIGFRVVCSGAART